MTLRSIQRGSAPVAIAALLTFGCATVRAPASAIDGDVQVGEAGPESQVELWLESSAPVSEAEKAQAVAQVRGALDRATATLVSDDGETLLVVRAQGIARTGSRKANQSAAKVGIVVGAAALIAVVVVAAMAGKGGGGGGSAGSFLKGGASAARSAPGGTIRVAAAAPRLRMPAISAGRGHVDAPHGVVAVQLNVPAPYPGDSAPAPGQAVAVGPLEPAEPEEAGERTAFPPREPVTLHLPRPRPLDMKARKFFDKDFTRLELLVVDRQTGEPTWVKTIEGPVDPRDPQAVKRLLARGIDDPAGWERAGPPR